MKKQNFFYLLLGATLVSSCVKDKYDFTNAELNYSAKFNLPLINSSIITEDLLKNLDTTLVTKGSDNLLKVILSDTIMTIGMDEFVKFNDLSLNDDLKLGPIAMDDKTETSDILLSQMISAVTAPIVTPFDQSPSGLSVPVQNLGTITDFTSLTFSKGDLKIDITNNFTFGLSNLKVKFKSGVDVIGDVTFPNLPVGSTSSQTVDLSGQTLSNVITYEIYSFDAFIPAGTTLSPTDKMKLDVNILNTEIVKGNAIFPSDEVVNDTFDVVLPSTNGEEFEQVILKNASLDFTINYGVAENSKMNIVLPYATKDGVAFKTEFTIGANSTVSKNFDLSGYTIDLTAGGTTFNTFQANVIDSIVSSGVAVAFDTSNVITYDLKISGMSVDYVKGYFGQQSVAFTDQTIETGFGDDPLINTFKFADPKISLSFTNSFNLPFSINKSGSSNPLSIEMIGGPDGNVALTGLTETNILAGNTITPVKTPLLIDKSSTNIVDAFNSKPTQSKVSGSGLINPAGKTVNEAWSNSKLVIVSDIEVPLYGSVNGMEVRDTSDMDLESLFENLASVTLRANILNDFPLDGSIEIEFTDESYNTLGYLVGAGNDGIFMSAAAVDANGVGIPATVPKITDFKLDEAKVSALKNTKKAIIIVKISTEQKTDGSYTDMKFLSSYNMAIKLGIIAQVKIKQSFTN